jgi:hypothetical protein
MHMVEHVAVKLPKAFASRSRIAFVAQGFTEGDGVSPDPLDRFDEGLVLARDVGEIRHAQEA